VGQVLFSLGFLQPAGLSVVGYPRVLLLWNVHSLFVSSSKLAFMHCGNLSVMWLLALAVPSRRSSVSGGVLWLQLLFDESPGFPVYLHYITSHTITKLTRVASGCALQLLLCILPDYAMLTGVAHFCCRCSCWRGRSSWAGVPHGGASAGLGVSTILT
jgi:hypothetical protein